MNNVNFVPKDVKRILSSHKISEEYNEQEVFYKIYCSQKFRNIHKETPVLKSLFNKNANIQACYFIKKRLQQGVFLTILRNFCPT